MTRVTPPAKSEKSLSPFTGQLGELIKGEPRTIPGKATVVEAARLMKETGVGSLIVTDDDQPIGLVTKTDLAHRVLAQEKSPQTPIAEVASPNLITVDQSQPIFDGLLVMIRHNIGHLVVMDGDRLAGVISERDWLLFQERHPAALLRHFETAQSVEALAALRAKANRMVHALFMQEGNARALTQLVTEINDRVSRRVIELTLAGLEDEGHGPPPTSFAWISMGSEGRAEQTLSTDQDNGLVFEDLPDDATREAQQWFLRFASRVVDGLDICGFPRCKGNIMASNPDLCLPLSGWKNKFKGLIQQADPEALLRACIYFDFRCLYGEQHLVDDLWSTLTDTMAKNRGFLRHLAGNVMGGRPPVQGYRWRLRAWLGMRQPALDLKKQGIAPLTFALRLMALAAGSSETNSMARLQIAREHDMISPRMAQAIESAYDFLMLLRLRQNFKQVARGDVLNNQLRPESLNPLQRRFLEEALGTVAYLQDHVFTQYGGIQFY